MDSKALQYIKKLGPLIGLILLFVIISVMNDSFLEFSNLRNLLRQVSINAIIAFGMTFVILTGGIDLSVGSILALSSAVMANLIVTGTDPVLALSLIHIYSNVVATSLSHTISPSTISAMRLAYGNTACKSWSITTTVIP